MWCFGWVYLGPKGSFSSRKTVVPGACQDFDWQVWVGQAGAQKKGCGEISFRDSVVPRADFQVDQLISFAFSSWCIIFQLLGPPKRSTAFRIPGTRLFLKVVSFNSQIVSYPKTLQLLCYLFQRRPSPHQVAQTKIWCYGPETDGANLVVDSTVGVQYLIEIKDPKKWEDVFFGWLKKLFFFCWF